MPLRAFNPKRQQQIVAITEHTQLSLNWRQTDKQCQSLKNESKVKYTFVSFVFLIEGNSSELFIKHTGVKSLNCIILAWRRIGINKSTLGQIRARMIFLKVNHKFNKTILHTKQKQDTMSGDEMELHQVLFGNSCDDPFPAGMNCVFLKHEWDSAQEWKAEVHQQYCVVLFLGASHKMRM